MMIVMVETELRGVRVVVRRYGAVYGTPIWWGEFRDDDDRPVWTVSRQTNHRYEVRFGHDPDEVVAALDRLQAATLASPPPKSPGYARVAPERGLRYVTETAMRQQEPAGQ